MKFLIIGLGSMGKRRIRNLLFHKVKKNNIYGFDLSEDRCEEVTKKYQVQTFTNFALAVKQVKPTTLIISTPPHLHEFYFLYAAEHHLHFFVEVATTDQGYDKLQKILAQNKELVAAPSCSYRFYQPIKKIKKLLDMGKIGRVQAFTHHMGQYLPDWHPWENYRQFYVSQAASSACREMLPFELSWLTWLFQDEFIEARGLTGKCSDLDLKIDDTYLALLKSKKGILGNLMIEVIARFPFRSLRILGSQGVLEWEWQEQQIRLYQSKTKKWSTINLKAEKKLKAYRTSTEGMYQDEIKAFLRALDKKEKFPYTFEEDQKNFRILKIIEGK